LLLMTVPPFQNDGSKSDAKARAKKEFAAWPYPWLDDEAYHARGKVSGKLVLSDGRPAAKAAVFLGDNKPTKSTLGMGSTYYYTTYADDKGNFEFTDVRAAAYGLQAWSNGAPIADVSTSFLRNDVSVAKGKTTKLGALAWPLSTRTRLFQVGDFDHYSYGFLHGGAPYENGLVASCPADLVYQIGRSKPDNWCFGQTHKGNWTIEFNVPEAAALATPRDPTLIVSLAGYSAGANSTVWANGHRIGNMTSGSPQLKNDPSVYRSATAAGEWRLLEFPFDAAVLREGVNTVTFQLTGNTTWRGFMWDSIILDW
jgi:rhamnogalacturonan endolyase